jgi:PilZ domain-containing protein
MWEKMALQLHFCYYLALNLAGTCHILILRKGMSIMADKRKIRRRDFTYYMQVTDDLSKKLIGYIADISTGGFRLDSPKQIPAGQDFRMNIALTADIADKTSMVFIARSKWCHPDHVDPNTYNVGFEIINMAPSDMVIFQRMFDKYGSQNTTRNRSSDDYLWK